MPITPTSKIWMDGSLVDWNEARVHVLTHGLHYGTGVFEGIRAYRIGESAAIFRLRDHIERFKRSAYILSMELPYSSDELIEAVRSTVSVNGLTECYIRPIGYLGYGEMGLNPLPCPVSVSIAVWPWGAYLGDEGIENGIRAKISSWARHDARSVPTAAKATGLYINSALAKAEAVRAGYDEAILCTTDGYVCEGTGENIFVVRDGVIVTPPMSAVGALEGITAASVRTIAGNLGFEIRFELVRRSELYVSDEAFLTGTAAEVVPLASVDDRVIGTGRPGPVTRAIQDVFFAAIRGEVDQYKDWLDIVD